MQINLDNISTQEPQFTKQKHNSTIVIDNGTFNLKAGFISNQPSVIFRNRIYKNKQGFLLTDTQSSLRSMFERDLLINVEILEATLDIVFDHTGTCENLIFTTVVDIPKLFLGPVISLLFEVYKFKKIQIGVDAFYSYLYNVKENERGKQKIFFDEIENIENDIDNNNLEILNNETEKCILADNKNIKEEEKTDENNKNDNFISNNKTDKCLSADKKNIKEEEKTDDENIKKFKYDMLNSKKNFDSHVEFNNKNLSEKKTVNETDLIISLSHYNTLVYIVQNEKIVKYYKLPFGGLLASEYLQMLLTSKYSDFNFKINLRESEYLLKNLKVALDFNKESNDIYERLKTCNAEFGLTSKSIKQIQDSLTQKPKEKRNLPKVFKKEELQESQNLFESDLFDEESNFENEKK
ncbi:Actin- protein 5 [Gurleya vavrai]